MRCLNQMTACIFQELNCVCRDESCMHNAPYNQAILQFSFPIFPLNFPTLQFSSRVSSEQVFFVKFICSLLSSFTTRFICQVFLDRRTHEQVPLFKSCRDQHFNKETCQGQIHHFFLRTHEQITLVKEKLLVLRSLNHCHQLMRRPLLAISLSQEETPLAKLASFCSPTFLRRR